MSNQIKRFDDFLKRFCEEHGFDTDGIVDLYASNEDSRPEFRVYALGPKESRTVIKMFDRSVSDGPQVAFNKSWGIPKLIARTVEYSGFAASCNPRVVRVLSVAVENAVDREPLQYFTMEHLPVEADWSRQDTVNQAIAIIDGVQNCLLFEHFSTGMSHLAQGIGETAQIVRQMQRHDERGDTSGYTSNFAQSIQGLRECTAQDKPSSSDTERRILKDQVEGIIEESLRHFERALQVNTQPRLVLAHRDTGLENFSLDNDGQLCLFDFEHTRWDNPLSDLTHLWIRLKQKNHEESAGLVMTHMMEKFRDKEWFRPVLGMCVAEKLLGELNHVSHQRHEREISTLSSIIEKGHQLLDIVGNAHGNT